MNNRPMVDRNRSACLDDVGGGHRSAFVAVTADGRDVLWLVDHDHADDSDDADYGCACQRCAPHERTGPLPAHVRGLVARAKPRCGRPRADGRPCRNVVATCGDACHHHRPPTHAEAVERLRRDLGAIDPDEQETP